MSRLPVRACSLLLAWLLLAACSEVSPSNPFDPATPGSQQATGRVVGRLVLPTGFGAQRLQGAQVTLRPQADPASVTATAEVDAEGAFALTDVVAGLYSVQVQVVGLSLTPIAIELTIGGVVDLGDLLLEAPPEGLAAVLGRVQRSGAAEDGHQGIVIEALGTPYSAVTTSDGTFRPAVAAGEHTLRSSAPGYAPQTAPLDPPLAAGEVRTLEATVVLIGRPGAVRGVVGLEPGFEDAELLRTATLTLAHPGAALDDEATREARPDGDGRFLFDAVPAGEWTLTATLETFQPVTLPLTVRVGETTTAPPVTLFSTLTVERPELAGVFEGQVTRQGAPPDQHGGIRVQATGTPFVAQTADDGRYRLEVAGGRAYTTCASAPRGTPRTSRASGRSSRARWWRSTP